MSALDSFKKWLEVKRDNGSKVPREKLPRVGLKTSKLFVNI